VVEHAVDEASREHRQACADLRAEVRRLEPIIGDLPVVPVLDAVHVDQRLDVHAERASLLDLGARQELAGAIPRELLAAVGAIGSAEEIAAAIAAYRSAGADDVAIVPATAEDPAGARSLSALSR
jgi:alkanesulfonate monooxygenase SsuD/methylene tetrahydromethanopterin reductase-like flavin-dependent oxidoreductase (luciferase family)